jgi:tetratricopeptide (TPR) repeat protein
MLWRILILFLFATASYAQDNTIKAISGMPSSNVEMIKIEMVSPIHQTPDSFDITTPPTLVMDFEDVTTVAPRSVSINQGNVRSVSVVQSDTRTRVIINLFRHTDYRLMLRGNSLMVVLDNPFETATPMDTRPPKELLAVAKKVLAEGKDPQEAIDALNALLMLPPDATAQEAQELIAVAYEKAGNPAKAMAELRAYIAMYPNSRNITSLRQHLIAMEIATPPVHLQGLAARKPRTGKESKVDTSITEYYYSSGDQAALISNVRTSAMFRDDEFTTKLQYRHSTYSTITGTAQNRNLISVAFADWENTYRGYGFRVGRQQPADGAIGRYDGVSGRYAVSEASTVKVLFGIPYTGDNTAKRRFYSLAYSYFNGTPWSFDAYYDHQTADSLPERQALGLTARYFKNDISATAIVEYDFLYRVLNTTMFQSNMKFGDYGIYILADRRKSPVLFANRALLIGLSGANHQAYDTVAEVLEKSGLSHQSIYQFINETTPYSSVYVLGVNKQITPKWNLSVDAQFSNTTASTDPEFIPSIDMPVSLVAQQGSGRMMTLNAQLYGQNVREKGNSINALVSLTKGAESSGYTLTFLDSTPYKGLRFDTMMMYSKHHTAWNSTGNLTASLKVNYKINERSTFEAQVSLTKTNTQDQQNEISSSAFSQTVFLGWRIDF